MRDPHGQRLLLLNTTKAMELEGEDGSRIALQDGQKKTVFGRGLGFHTNDRTVSRRHVLLGVLTSEDKSGSQTGPKVSFEVVGKNPIWVRESGGGGIRVFRRDENGVVAPGDWLCFSGRTPVWFTVRGSRCGEGEKRVLGCKNGLDANLRSGFDVSEIDPVKGMHFMFLTCFAVIWCFWLLRKCREGRQSEVISLCVFWFRVTANFLFLVSKRTRYIRFMSFLFWYTDYHFLMLKFLGTILVFTEVDRISNMSVWLNCSSK
jgi:hypothetical protein